MGIIGTIVIGFIVGLVARMLKPGRDSMGFIMTTVLGIVGAFLATYLGQAMGFYYAGEPAGFIGAVVGAIVVLAIVHFASNRHARTM
ncbi:MAG: GlsB/YeaQ/YmgE family stress response membrane protein [Bdellovibrionota bacterium]